MKRKLVLAYLLVFIFGFIMGYFSWRRGQTFELPQKVELRVISGSCKLKYNRGTYWLECKVEQEKSLDIKWLTSENIYAMIR